MINFVNTNDSKVPYTSTATAITAGEPIVAGNLILIPDVSLEAGNAGQIISCCIAGIFRFKKKAATALAFGTKLYWDAANKQVDTTHNSNANMAIGYVARAAAADDEEVEVTVWQNN